MKKLLASLTLLVLSFSAQASSMVFNQVLLLKDLRANDFGVHYVVNRSTETWCTGYGSPMSIGTLEAAELLDGLENGLYTCEGKFVQVPGDRTNPVQMFSISSCSEVNVADLKAKCAPSPKH